MTGRRRFLRGQPGLNCGGLYQDWAAGTTGKPAAQRLGQPLGTAPFLGRYGRGLLAAAATGA
ncbi:MAG: hypothetical protein ABR915_06125 [Thermoguttaceae bacterium]